MENLKPGVRVTWQDDNNRWHAGVVDSMKNNVEVYVKDTFGAVWLVHWVLLREV